MKSWGLNSLKLQISYKKSYNAQSSSEDQDQLKYFLWTNCKAFHVMLDFTESAQVLNNISIISIFGFCAGEMVNKRTPANLFETYAPISVMPHYPPPGHNRDQYRGIDVETQAPYRGI